MDTVVTHPVELFHLRYRLSASSGDGPSAASSGRVAEITCTGEHPFFVGNRAQPDFVPARELQPGDSLSFSSGGQGQVISLSSERAPPGQTFTTYNFEVADFHTYFAGEGGVWVHNFSTHFCEKLAAACWHSKKWLGIDNPVGNRFEILKHSFMHLFDVGKVPFDSLSGNRSLLVTALEELRDYSQHGDFKKIASFYDQKFGIVQKYFGKPPAGDFEVHHLVEKRISKALGLKDAGKLDSSPGINLPERESLWSGKTKDIDVFDGPIVYHQGQGGIAGAIEEIFKKFNIPMDGRTVSDNDKRLLVTSLRELYSNDPRFKHLNLWPASRDWLKDQFPNLQIPN